MPPTQAFLKMMAAMVFKKPSVDNSVLKTMAAIIFKNACYNIVRGDENDTADS